MIPKSSNKAKSRISLRFILICFALLTIYVIMNLLSTTSRLSVVHNMSTGMKAGIFNALNETFTTGSDDNETVNGTFSLRTFYSKFDVLKDYGQRFRSTSYGFDDTAKTLLEQSVININNHMSNSTNTMNSVPVNIYGNSNMSLKVRQTSCYQCFVHNFSYIIQNEHICNVSDGKTVDLLLLILTTHQNIRARSAIRQTWVQPSERNTKHIRYAFLLGQTRDKRLDKLVQGENDVHHDIIKEDFFDSYKNLTYKTIMGFKWASTMCAHARYVMKTDDDMWVNIPKLLRTLDDKGPWYMETRIIGACSLRAKPNRNPKSKWFASKESYPESVYPGFCSGTGYVTSMNVVKKVYEISSNVPFFYLEDVYVSLCVNKLNFTLTPTPGFFFVQPKFDHCLYKGEKLITAHKISPHILMTIWNNDCKRAHNQTQQMPDRLQQKMNVTIKYSN